MLPSADERVVNVLFFCFRDRLDLRHFFLRLKIEISEGKRDCVKDAHSRVFLFPNLQWCWNQWLEGRKGVADNVSNFLFRPGVELRETLPNL